MEQKTIDDILGKTSKVIQLKESVSISILCLPEKYWNNPVVSTNVENLMSLQNPERDFYLENLTEDLCGKISQRNLNFDMVFIRKESEMLAKYFGLQLSEKFNKPLYVERKPFVKNKELDSKRVLVFEKHINDGWYLDDAAEYIKRSGGELVQAATLVIDTRKSFQRVGWLKNNESKVVSVFTQEDYLNYHKPVLEKTA